MDLKKSLGLHKNFKNLTPIYDQMKYRRAKDMADAWLDKISVSLLKKVEVEAAKNFGLYVEAGHRLSYGDLRKLNTLKKGAYIKEIIKEDDKTQQYLKGV